MSPAFGSNACVVFAAGPIGAALAVFRSNCEARRTARTEKGQRRAIFFFFARLVSLAGSSRSSPTRERRDRG
jgi:hypothetical protein